ncbi:MAG: hypothetical protein Q8P34_17265 [Bacteroidota bacterium]|nr:hypothetical protein [Bacteroidota bacterium]
MKTVILVIVNFLLILPAAKSQESNKSKISFGYIIGGGQNSNGYRLTTDGHGFVYSEGGILFSTGINTSFFVTERLRPRLEFTYSEMKYGMDLSGFNSDFYKSVTKTMNLNVNLNFDYLVLNKNKFQLFLSPGFVSEFVVGRTHKNYFTDGTVNFANYNVFTQQYPSAIAGANFSILAKYKLNEHFGLTLTPGYNYYFRNYMSVNEKAYTRALLNFGVEYTY